MAPDEQTTTTPGPGADTAGATTAGAGVPDDVRVNAIHHLAASTADMKHVLEFYTRVLGMELRGLFWLHGVPGGFHAFLHLNDRSTMSFVFLPAMADIEEQLGVTHARTGADTTAPGTMQHLAFGVDDAEQLLAMRDRIRSNGYRVMGPLSHGFCESIYFRGPEGAVLEVSYFRTPIDGDRWIDPEVVAACGISPDELATMRTPPPFAGAGGTVANPAPDPSKPDLRNSPEVQAFLDSMTDEELYQRLSFDEPPVPDPNGG
ncbi:MAG: VOC family protein [Actinomycetota bacterium]